MRKTCFREEVSRRRDSGVRGNKGEDERRRRWIRQRLSGRRTDVVCLLPFRLEFYLVPQNSGSVPERPDDLV